MLQPLWDLDPSVPRLKELGEARGIEVLEVKQDWSGASERGDDAGSRDAES